MCAQPDPRNNNNSLLKKNQKTKTKHNKKKSLLKVRQIKDRPKNRVRRKEGEG